MNPYDFTGVDLINPDITSRSLLEHLLRIDKKLRQNIVTKMLVHVLSRMMNLITNYNYCALSEWNGISGFVSLKKVKKMQQVIKELPDTCQVLELGCYKGRSAVAIASVLPDQGILYCIDHFQGSPEMESWNIDSSNLLRDFHKKIKYFGVDDKIKVFIMTGEQAVDQFEAESLDLIFIDAAHDYDSVKSDLLCWYPKLKSDGFLFCDDYEESWVGVIQAVKDIGLDGQVVAPKLWMHQKLTKGI